MAGNATITIRDCNGQPVVPGAAVTVRQVPAPSEEAGQARRAEIQTRAEKTAERKAAADRLYSRRAELDMRISRMQADLVTAKADLAQAVAFGENAGDARKLVSRFERELGELSQAIDMVNKELAKLTPGASFGGHRVVG